MPTQTETDIEQVAPDFAEVEWKVASAEVTQRVTDYGSLEAVKKLLEGEVIEVPADTYLNRLYRWLKKNGYHLRRRKFKGSLLVWAEKAPVEESKTTE